MDSLIEFRIDFKDNPFGFGRPWLMRAERIPVVGEFITHQGKKFVVETVEFNCDHGTAHTLPLLQCRLVES